MASNIFPPPKPSSSESYDTQSTSHHIRWQLFTNGEKTQMQSHIDHETEKNSATFDENHLYACTCCHRAFKAKSIISFSEHRYNMSHKIVQEALAFQYKDEQKKEVIGDINEDITSNGKHDIFAMLTNYKFIQHVKKPTGDSGTIIYHVYTKKYLLRMFLLIYVTVITVIMTL